MSQDSIGSGSLRCDITDELEAAIVLKEEIRVYLNNKEHKVGRPTDIKIQGHEEYLLMRDHVPIPISDIIRVERVRGAHRKVA